MAIYNPSDISGLLNVKESTLRKYSLLLEECGYKFDRNEQKQRWYSDKDVIALQKLMTFKNSGAMSLKECAEAVYLWSKGDDVTDTLTVSHNGEERHDVAIKEEELSELKSLVLEQQMYIADLGKKLDERFEKQEQRDKYLFKTIEDLTSQIEKQREEQQLLLSPPVEEKQGLLSRIFKK